VRRAAADAVGKLKVRPAAAELVLLARDADAGVRRTSLESLRLLGDRRAVPPAVAALADPETRLTGLRCLADLGGPEQADAVVDLARRDPSAEVLPLVLRMLSDWAVRRPELERAVADLQGTSGILARWRVTGPVSADAALLEGQGARGQTRIGAGTEARIALGKGGDGTGWLASTELAVPERTPVQFLGAGSVGLRVWLNGRPVYRRDGIRPFRPDTERFEAVLASGTNRVVVWAEAKDGAVFHLRFRRKGTTAEHERLAETALTRPGDVARGRKVFFDVARSQCLKCHRVGDQGERIGPELTGVGSRFPRIHLIESILQPSRTIAPGYQTLVVTLKDGRVLTGVRTAETDATLTLGDNQGKQHVLRKADIEEQVPQATSIMPEGLEKPLTVDEFVDLIAFLASLKADRPR
jgi:putative heme-binding domain-containing protein